MINNVKLECIRTVKVSLSGVHSEVNSVMEFMLLFIASEYYHRCGMCTCGFVCVHISVCVYEECA